MRRGASRKAMITGMSTGTITLTTIIDSGPKAA